MKLAIALIFSLSPLAFAVQCPNETREILKCKSTPKAGDSELVSSLFDSISVCRNNLNNEAYLIASHGPTSGYEKVEVHDGLKGSTYNVTDSLGREISFSASPAWPVGAPIAAKLKVEFQQAEGGLSGACSYTCTRPL